MRHLLSGFLLSLLLLAGTGATAADEHRPELSVGITQFTYLSFERSTPSRYGLDVSLLVPVTFGSATPELGGGLRTAYPFEGAPVPLEAYGQARFAAKLGYWRPAAGVELGVSGFTQLPLYEGWPNDDYEYEQRRLFAPYLAFNAAALRFQVMERWVVSALELQTGATLWRPGAALRFQLGLIRVGGVL